MVSNPLLMKSSNGINRTGSFNREKLMTRIQYSLGNWHYFNITLKFISNDPFISDLKFFDDSGSISGKIRIVKDKSADFDFRMEIELMKGYSGVTITKQNDKKMTIVIDSSGWNFELFVWSQHVCSD